MADPASLPPGQYQIELTHTAPDGRKSKMTIHKVMAASRQVLEFRDDDDVDIIADNIRVTSRTTRKLLRLEFDDVTVLEKDGCYFTVEEVMG
jgi:hypothetical protein